MDEKALFTKFWTKESKTTAKVLSRIPEGSDYKPDAKSRTALTFCRQNNVDRFHRAGFTTASVSLRWRYVRG